MKTAFYVKLEKCDTVDHHSELQQFPVLCAIFSAILSARDNGKLIMLAIYHKLEMARSPWPTFIRVGQVGITMRMRKFQIAISR